MNALVQGKATRRWGLFWSVILILCAGCSTELHASIHTWIGSAGGAWSNPANWSGGLPTTGEALPTGTIVEFGTNTISVCDLSVTVDQIHFTGGGNIISGNNSNVLSISGSLQSNNIVSDTGSNTIAGTVPVSRVGGTIFILVPTGMVTLACNISGTGTLGLRVLGTGASGVTFSGSNTYTGLTTVATGTLRLNSNGTDLSIQAGSVTVGVGSAGGATLIFDQSLEIANTVPVTVLADGTFNLNGKSETVGPLTVNNGSVLLGLGSLAASSLTMSGGSITGSGNLNLGGDVTVNGANSTATISAPLRLNGDRTFTVAAGVAAISLNITGVISDGSVAGSGLTKSGSGTMQISGALPNTYTGGTTVAAGTLVPTGASTQVIPAGPLTIGTGAGPGAVLRLGNTSVIDNTVSLVVNADGTFVNNGFFEQVGSTTVAGGQITISTSAFSSGPIIMVGGSISMASGSLTLGTSLNMTGGTISAPALTLGINMTATSGPDGSSAVINCTSIVLSGGSRTFTVNPGVAPELVVRGVVSDGGNALGINKIGTGTMNLTGASSNTYTGQTNISVGVLQMLQDTGRTISGPIVIGNNVDPPGRAVLRELINNDLAQTVTMQIGASGVFDMNGHSDTIATMSGSGAILMPSFSVFTVNVDNSTSSFSGSINGPGTFKKAGSGTLTLTGSCNVSRLTANEGILQLNMSGGAAASALQAGDGAGVASSAILRLLQTSAVANVSTIAVQSDGVLDLNGTSYNVTSISSSGILTLGTGSLSTSTLTLVGTPTFNLSFPPTPTQNVYFRLSYGSRTGNFGPINGTLAGYTQVIDYSEGYNVLHVAYLKNGVATTGVASSVLGASATLNGTINPGGKLTSGFFRYGTSSTYSNQTTAVKNLSGVAALPVSTVIAGLNGGTLYHFQIVASNADGIIFGDDSTFTTLGATVDTTAATNVNALAVDLNAMVNPNGSATTVTFEYGLTTTFGLKTGPIVLPSGSSNVPVSLHVTGMQPGRTYYCRAVATNAQGITRGNVVGFVTNLVLPPHFTPGGTPLSIIRVAGGLASFTTLATESSPSPTDAPLSYQWLRNGKAIPGATFFTYTFTASLANAGAYTCVVRNLAGAITTPVAELGVVEVSALKIVNKALGASHTITVATAGNFLSYAWQKNGVPLPNNTGKTYILTNLQSINSGDYTCLISNAGGGVTFGTTRLSVFTEKPVVLTPVNPTAGIVGGTYSFPIPIDTSPARAPTSYVVKGLPKGLKVDTVGLISGRIIAIQTGPQNYPLLITASNAAGTSTEVSATLAVSPFPSASLGVYNGTITRNAIDNPHGGSISLTLTGLGSFTGRIGLVGTSYPISGVFNASVGSSTLSNTAVIKRTGFPDFTFNLFIDTAGSGMAGTVLKPGAVTVATVEAGRNPFSAASPFARIGTFTSQFKIQDPAKIGDNTYPQGRGYATVVVKADGSVTCVAKMADGSAPTPTTFATKLDSTGEFLMHFMVNGRTGSVQGFADITPELPVAPVNGGAPLLSGVVDWFKATQPLASTDRVYKSGIPLHNLDWLGGKYIAPPPNTPVLGLTPSGTLGVNNAKFAVTFGGLTSVDTVPLSRALRITPTNTADFTNPADGNPLKLKLTVNAATGAISGSFTASSNRNATFSGLLITRTDIRAGAAYFLMPGTVPSITTSPILSGAILLLPP